MEKQDRKNVPAVQKLLSYGSENPMASDTAEGIAKWCIKMPVDEVLPALESLVEIGRWEKLRRDDRILYRPARFIDPKERR